MDHGSWKRGLEALQAIALVSVRGRDARAILDVAIEAIQRAFEAEFVIYYRVERGRSMLVPEVHRGLTAAIPWALRDLHIEEGLAGYVARSGTGQVTSDYAHDPRAYAEPRSLGVKSVAVAPVALEGEVLGVALVASREASYDKDDLGVLAAIGHQLAAALKTARLVAALGDSNERHRTLVETVPHVVYEAACDGALSYLSPKIEELVGLAPDKLLGDRARFEALVHPEDRERRRAKLAELDRPGARATVEYRLLHSNGRDIVWVADQAVARAARPEEVCPAGRLFVVTGTLLDIRERKLLEAAAREQSRLASLGELAAGIAHEINNPLSGVINYAQLAKKLLPAGERRLQEPLEGIAAEADRILEITRTLVATARRPADEDLRPLDARELVKSSLTLLKQSLKEDSIRIDVQIDEGLPPLRARGHELQMVLENLLTNARHALNARFPRWDPEKVLMIRVRRADDDRIRLEVQDRGCGISEENLPRIWDPFFTTRKDGTGLGLPITRRIVAAHGGSISVESKPGAGTTFSAELPAWR